MRKSKAVIILIALCIIGLFTNAPTHAQLGLYGNIYGLGGLYGGLYGIGFANPINSAFALLSAPNTIPAPVIQEPVVPPFIRSQAFVLPTVTPTATVPVAPPPVPVVIVTTTWIGGWYILNTSASTGPQTGTMTLQLTQNTATGQLDGIVDFGATNVVPLPVSVTGVLLPGATTFDLNGIYFDPLVGQPANIDLVCTITSSTTISGTLTIISWKGINFGSFYLTLL